MARLQELTAGEIDQEGRYWLSLVSRDDSGSCHITVPAGLKGYQGELEFLLGKVFAGRPLLPENVALAQQMSLNWCLSKCREVGITFEESLLDDQ